MNYSAREFVVPLPLDTLVTNGLTPLTYYEINDDGFPGGVIILTISNQANGRIIISYDGTNPHDTMLAEEVRTFNIQTANNYSMLKKGTIVWVATAAGLTGNVYLSGFYTALKGA